MKEPDMEQRLKRLVEGNSETNMVKWAQEAKKQSKPIVGMTCPYVPEEVIIAAGMHPWRITGSHSPSLSRALAYRSIDSDGYHSHIVESILAGELDFLDAVINTSREDDSRALDCVIGSLDKFSLVHLMSVPQIDTALAVSYYAYQIEGLKSALEALSGKVITAAALSQAIELCNETRGLLRKIYELRKRPWPAVSGMEALGIAMSARIMNKEEFNKELKELLPYLDGRKAPLKSVQLRLLVSGDTLDDPRYLQLIEEQGCVVAMDDLDTGSRYCWEDCKIDGSDPISSLAKHYLSLPDFARQINWDRQLDRIIQWVREFDVHGVLELRQLYQLSRQTRTPFLIKNFKEAGIPFFSIERDYQLSASGQLGTRVGAFLETLSL
ncbi:2-hydroxyacyl-CoA dehydratase subunit D [Chloroflexota bacterium]